MAIHLGLRQVKCLYRRIGGWPIPNILKVLERIGTLKPKMFGLIDFTAGYHQTPLHEKSRDLSAFITADGLYQ